MDAAANTTTRYYYDDQRIALQTSVAGGTETDSRYFVYGNYIDEVLLMSVIPAQAGIQDFYYAHDHLYSPVAIFGPTGSVLERYEYDVYGKARIFGAGADGVFFTADDQQRSVSLFLIGNPFAFTGRELDNFDLDTNGNPRLKIMYYRARYYDMQTGRFLQRDPLGEYNISPIEEAKEALRKLNIPDAEVNPYQYVKSNPYGLLDPLGLIAVSKKDGVKWTANGTFLPIGGLNTWVVKLSAEACGCKFEGSPRVSEKLTHRWLFSGKLISERGPVFYRENNCECYVYTKTYKWYQGMQKPPGLPGWIPWPIEGWMQTEITLKICADGSGTATKINSTNRAWVAEDYGEGL